MLLKLPIIRSFYLDLLLFKLFRAQSIMLLLIYRKLLYLYIYYIYCILRGQIKGFNRSITTIMCEDGSYRTVVG